MQTNLVRPANNRPAPAGRPSRTGVFYPFKQLLSRASRRGEEPCLQLSCTINSSHTLQGDAQHPNPLDDVPTKVWIHPLSPPCLSFPRCLLSVGQWQLSLAPSPNPPQRTQAAPPKPKWKKKKKKKEDLGFPHLPLPPSDAARPRSSPGAGHGPCPAAAGGDTNLSPCFVVSPPPPPPRAQQHRSLGPAFRLPLVR